MTRVLGRRDPRAGARAYTRVMFADSCCVPAWIGTAAAFPSASLAAGSGPPVAKSGEESSDSEHTGPRRSPAAIAIDRAWLTA